MGKAAWPSHEFHRTWVRLGILMRFPGQFVQVNSPSAPQPDEEEERLVRRD
jgi:hypothetical protein